VALEGAVLPLGERVGLLEPAAAGARRLHRSDERTYLFVALLVSQDAAPRLGAAVALPTALDLVLVDADDPQAAVAFEALVRPLPVLVAVLEELGLLCSRLWHLDRILVGLLALFVVANMRLCLAVKLVLLRVVAAVGQHLVLSIGQLVLLALDLMAARVVRLVILARLVGHVLHLDLGVADLALVDRLVLVVGLGGALCDDGLILAANYIFIQLWRRHRPVPARVEHNVAFEL
jgi:hypothetical protein